MKVHLMKDHLDESLPDEGPCDEIERHPDESQCNETSPDEGPP